MEDIRERDLSQIPEEDLTQEERHELRRRFKEFVGVMRKNGVNLGGGKKSEKKKSVRRWDPSTMGRRSSRH